MRKAKTTPVGGRLILKFRENGEVYHVDAMGRRAMAVADGIMDVNRPCPICGNHMRDGEGGTKEGA